MLSVYQQVWRIGAASVWFHSVTVSHGTLNPVTQVRLLVEPIIFSFFFGLNILARKLDNIDLLLEHEQ